MLFIVCMKWVDIPRWLFPARNRPGGSRIHTRVSYLQYYIIAQWLDDNKQYSMSTHYKFRWIIILESRHKIIATGHTIFNRCATCARSPNVAKIRDQMRRSVRLDHMGVPKSIFKEVDKVRLADWLLKKYTYIYIYLHRYTYVKYVKF